MLIVDDGSPDGTGGSGSVDEREGRAASISSNGSEEDWDWAPPYVAGFR